MIKKHFTEPAEATIEATALKGSLQNIWFSVKLREKISGQRFSTSFSANEKDFVRFLSQKKRDIYYPILLDFRVPSRCLRLEAAGVCSF